MYPNSWPDQPPRDTWPDRTELIVLDGSPYPTYIRPRRRLANALWGAVAAGIVLAGFGVVAALILLAAQVSGT